jgi:uncharacterized protein YjbI with pentapeptide repeats
MCLPFSKRWTGGFVSHANIGATVLPDVVGTGGNGGDVCRGPVLSWFGVSGIWLLSGNVNLMGEVLRSINAEIGDAGEVIHTSQTIISPGVRVAINLDDLQMVPGVAFPIVFSGGRSDVQAFFSLSFEHRSVLSAVSLSITRDRNMKAPRRVDLASIPLPEDLIPFELDALQEAGEYTKVRLTERNLSGQAATGVIFERAHFQRVLLNRTRLSGAKLFDVRCEASDLSGAVWQKSRWQRVYFKGCKLTGMQLASFNGADVLFQECTMEGMIFSSGKLRGVRFEKCRMHRSVFDRMDISEARFHQCDLTGADLTGSTLAGVDLRGSDIPDIRLDVRQLRGLIIDPGQAVRLIAQLGSTVKDPGEE